MASKQQLRGQQQSRKTTPRTVALAAMAIATMCGHGVDSFSPPTRVVTNAKAGTHTVSSTSTSTSPSQLYMGLFDRFVAGGNGRDDLDDEFEKQQAILAARRAPQSERNKYFGEVEKRRRKADKERDDNWGWQTKQYKKGEDPIDEWKKRRESGVISDLDDQYGDPKKIGGIPLPMASFGVGGEFGVGGKFDNGGRFDLRLPYADQGYVDEDADVMGKLSDFFGGGKKKKEAEAKAAAAAAAAEEASKKKKKGGWPW
mmetsp:Transcript_15620/g.32396  ORF Transcript_15620/g.32396 Transcript_15620/m.32396 type:complete len:257 (+) Transcript_15620:49-819(+)|eukprot:CAMPEP_0168187382 /NCGR_PEP_ID=MMETSP0139_2-20121125/14998_1 /TAXON_ID=44445 /ORGANISM="Pseudo-nitzschia australis, Strain 10249 10 AB" /LENGTH=256 /DNA_ID=CAMNT_0008109577 /DNA_START=12 /DNA_END=782 /DNA_ORIENTATION=+